MLEPSWNVPCGKRARQAALAHLSTGIIQPRATWSLRSGVWGIMKTSGSLPLLTARANRLAYSFVTLVVFLIVKPGCAAWNSLISLSTHGAWETHQSQ